MDVRIVSKTFSLSGKKNIFLDNQKLYYTITDSVGGQECVKLIDKQSNIVISIIIRDITLLQDSYTIRFLNRENKPVAFKRTEYWKHNYEGSYHDDTYTIKENAFKVYGILKNGQEIGYWLKSRNFLPTNEDNFKLSDEITDFELVLSLCLIIHEKESDKRNQG
ncbi:hypothetical protein AM493_20020 [Flavobacterium akiainvivens]|uniref:LURP-one-related family protein n=1 Tax=Flavobacterium akiainvivens TaxID=1202724 RepID=A0A0M8ML71_9FLAO|nr:hypothetical protein [Flavobacterium akiainvivens]KOS08077.1 hypothetical protein AM493_20020 [Flavobacterium akiainvivens]